MLCHHRDDDSLSHKLQQKEGSFAVEHKLCHTDLLIFSRENKVCFCGGGGGTRLSNNASTGKKKEETDDSMDT